ncbi:MAG: hypothetical protein DELT_00588 [Desulfovibrio sp.]
MSKQFDEDQAREMGREAAKKLKEAYEKRKAKKSRRDIIAEMSTGIIDFLNAGMEVSEILAVLKETEVGKSTKESTLKTYIVSLCNTTARKQRAAAIAADPRIKTAVPATAPAKTAPATTAGGTA